MVGPVAVQLIIMGRRGRRQQTPSLLLLQLLLLLPVAVQLIIVGHRGRRQEPPTLLLLRCRRPFAVRVVHRHRVHVLPQSHEVRLGSLVAADSHNNALLQQQDQRMRRQSCRDIRRAEIILYIRAQVRGAYSIIHMKVLCLLFFCPRQKALLI